MITWEDKKAFCEKHPLCPSDAIRMRLFEMVKELYLKAYEGHEIVIGEIMDSSKEELSWHYIYWRICNPNIEDDKVMLNAIKRDTEPVLREGIECIKNELAEEERGKEVKDDTNGMA